MKHFVAVDTGTAAAHTVTHCAVQETREVHSIADHQKGMLGRGEAALARKDWHQL